MPCEIPVLSLSQDNHSLTSQKQLKIRRRQRAARQSWSLMTLWLGFDSLRAFSMRVDIKSRHVRILAKRCLCLSRILSRSIW